MKHIKTKELSAIQKKELLSLWNQEYPEKLAYETLSDFEDYLATLNEVAHHLLLDEEGKVKAWYFEFFRAKERWFALIVDSSLHGKRLGTMLLNQTKAEASKLNGWVIDHSKDKKRNGELYRSPLGFYQKNGFEVLSENRLELERISALKIRWEK